MPHPLSPRRSIDIDCEPLSGPIRLVLYANTITTWADGRAATGDEKTEIVANIRALLRPAWGEIAVE